METEETVNAMLKLKDQIDAEWKQYEEGCITADECAFNVANLSYEMHAKLVGM